MTTPVIHSVVQPLVELVDCSKSLDTPSNPRFNTPIHDINVGNRALYHDLKEVKHVDVHVMCIKFADEPVVEHDFASVQSLTPPTFTTFGSATDYSAAIGRAMVELEEYRDKLRATGLEVNQPWIFFMTDGLPNRVSNPGFEVELLAKVNAEKLVFIPVAVGGGDVCSTLKAISPRQDPIIVGSDEVDALSFQELFRWLSDSVQAGAPLDHPNSQAFDADDLD